MSFSILNLQGLKLDLLGSQTFLGVVELFLRDETGQGLRLCQIYILTYWNRPLSRLLLLLLLIGIIESELLVEWINACSSLGRRRLKHGGGRRRSCLECAWGVPCHLLDTTAK